MVSTKKIEGICSTCNHVPVCRILEKSQVEEKTIWHCEEFDDPNLHAQKHREKKNPVVMRSTNLIPGWD